MLKNVRYIAIAVLFLMPYSAHADIDITSYITRKAESFQRVSGSMAKIKIAGHQLDMQNLSNYNFSNMNLDNFKSQAQGMLQNGNKVLHVCDYMPSGMGGTINSFMSNPALEAAAKKEFVLSKRSGDDVEKNKQLKEKENELMIENVSLLYARGLVRRYMLEQEKPEEVEDLNNVSEVQTMFTNTIHRANNRWISILQSEASTMAQSAMKQLASIRTEEEEGADEQSNETSAQEGNKTENKSDKESGENKEKKKSKLQQASEWTKNQADKVSGWTKSQREKVNDWTNSQKDKVKDWTTKQTNAVNDWLTKPKENGDDEQEQNEESEQE